MKWIKEKDDELIKLVNQGKKYEEISVELGTTKRSVSNRCFRLCLKLVYDTEISCKKCGELFIANIKTERKFCSNSCANSFSNTDRIHSDESKKKTSNTLKDKNLVDGRSVKKYNKLIGVIEGKRKCKCCQEYKIDKKYKSICDNCRVNYYNVYRPSCEFDFDIKQNKDRFDFSLVKLYGWYSPTNKGNNINGVSKDHLYSVRDGFINKIDYNIIKHPANCNLMKHSDNNKKKTKSSITLEELLKRIEEWV